MDTMRQTSTNSNRRPRKRRNRVNNRSATIDRLESQVQSILVKDRTTIPRNLRVPGPFPTSMTTKLTANFNFVMQGASTYVVRDYLINSLYNFDVTGGTTTSFSGTNQLSSIYASYHVEHIQVSFSLYGNESSQGEMFGLIFNDVQPSTLITSFAKANNALEISPSTGPIVVGNTAGMNVYRTPKHFYKIPISTILGNPASYHADQDYTSSFGAFDPAQKIYMGAVGLALGGGNLTNGTVVQMTVSLTVRAYSIRPLQE